MQPSSSSKPPRAGRAEKARRSPIAAAAGKLISAIQKEWGEEAGRPESAVSEEVLHTSHGLLQAATPNGSIASAVGTRTLAEFLGTQWVHDHPKVWPHIQALEAAEGPDAGVRSPHVPSPTPSTRDSA